jgi:nitrogen regulatory protein PII
MDANRQTLLTVVTEAALERELLESLARLGVHGYTVTDARGRGTRGYRGAGWQPDTNVRLDIVCTAALAQTVVDHLHARFSDHYAMFIWLQDVRVATGAEWQP